MDEPDITWAVPGGDFKLRTAAVVRDGDDVLLCAVDGMPIRFLPGGKLRFGESSSAALTRELREELGIEFTVDAAPTLVAQGIRRVGDAVHQEVCFYHEVAWPSGLARGAANERAEDGHRFDWVPLSGLGSAGFVPMEIVPHLGAGPGVRHLSFERREDGIAPSANVRPHPAVRFSG